MPARTRFTRETVLDAAVALIRRDGMDALNARALARELGCSTQPIFRAFSSMEELQSVILRRAVDCYNGYIQSYGRTYAEPYKGTGIAYIRFAKEEPVFFKALYMCDRHGARVELSDDENMAFILESISKATGFSQQKALRFHQMMWVFVHGLAVMAATGYMEYGDEEISRLVSDHYQATRAYFLAMEA